MDVFVQEEEEIPYELDGGNQYGEDTDGNGTTFNWEASAARGLLGEFVVTDAITAAAWLQDWLGIWIIIVWVVLLCGFLLLLAGAGFL